MLRCCKQIKVSTLGIRIGTKKNMTSLMVWLKSKYGWELWLITKLTATERQMASLCKLWQPALMKRMDANENHLIGKVLHQHEVHSSSSNSFS